MTKTQQAKINAAKQSARQRVSAKEAEAATQAQSPDPRQPDLPGVRVEPTGNGKFRASSQPTKKAISIEEIEGKYDQSYNREIISAGELSLADSFDITNAKLVNTKFGESIVFEVTVNDQERSLFLSPSEPRMKYVDFFKANRSSIIEGVSLQKIQTKRGHDVWIFAQVGMV